MNRVLARVSLMLLALWLPTSVLAADDDADEAVLDQLDQARERGVLEVAVYRDFPPYSYPQQGKYVGADVDLAAALARKIGLPLKVRPIMPGDDADDDLRNNIWKGHYLGGGVADVMLHVGMDPQYVARQDKADLFSPYFREAVSIAYRPGRYKNLTTPMALVVFPNDAAIPRFLHHSLHHSRAGSPISAVSPRFCTTVQELPIFNVSTDGICLCEPCRRAESCAEK